MNKDTVLEKFSGALVILGYGAITQATLPLLLRHFDIAPEQIANRRYV